MSAFPISSSVHEFSSESKKYLANNLLNDANASWKCDQWQEYSWVVLKVAEQHLIETVEIINASSAFVEVFVSNSADGNYKVLVPVFNTMTTGESKNKTDCKRTFVFNSKHFSSYTAAQPWKYIKVVCSQPFNKSIRFGLSSIRICGYKKGETNTNTIERQFSPFGRFKLKVTPNDFHKDIFAAHDLNYKKGLIEIYEKKTKLTGSVPCEEETEKKDENYEQKEKRKNGKRPRKNKEDRTEEEDGGSGEKKTKKKKPIKEVASVQSVPGASSGADGGGPSSWPPPQQTGRYRKGDSGPKKAKPLDRLMSHVVFVLSGYENPLRSELRDKATAMGARYSPKWGSNCTHLICAFPNTPKYNEVKRLNGRIVFENWILDCYAQRQLLEWRNFMVGSYGGPDTPQHSEAEEEEEEDEEEGEETQPCPREDTNGRAKANADAGVAANDKRRVERSTTSTNGYDSDVIYDLDTESEDDD